MSNGILQGFDGNTGVAVVVIIAIFFLSILVHELGHAIAFRRYGYDCDIVLYMMGGLAIPRQGGWRAARGRSLTPPRHIVVAFAGPLFGFLLAGVLAAVLYGMGGSIVLISDGALPVLIPRIANTPMAGSQAAFLFFYVGLWINVFWSVINLMPVFPLDGGQIARQLFIMSDPWQGVRKSLMLAIVAAGLIGFWALSRDDRFMGIMFIYLGVMNYLELQQTGAGGSRPWN
jgi:Zn-dependent protease